MKRWLPHLLLIVIFIAQSSAGIVMATQMQTNTPTQASPSSISQHHYATITNSAIDAAGSHCAHHTAMQSQSASSNDCQHCTQADCSHCHCISSFSGMTSYLPFVAMTSDVPHYTGFATTTIPDTPPQRILRPPRFIA